MVTCSFSWPDLPRTSWFTSSLHLRLYFSLLRSFKRLLLMLIVTHLSDYWWISIGIDLYVKWLVFMDNVAFNIVHGLHSIVIYIKFVTVNLSLCALILGAHTAGRKLVISVTWTSVSIWTTLFNHRIWNESEIINDRFFHSHQIYEVVWNCVPTVRISMHNKLTNLHSLVSKVLFYSLQPSNSIFLSFDEWLVRIAFVILL